MSTGTESANPTRAAFLARAQEMGLTWYQPVIRGAAAVFLGAAAVFWPGLTIVVLTALIGIFAVVDGVLSIFDGVRERSHFGAEFQVAAGVVSLLAGLVLLVWPAPTLFVLTLLMGLFTVAGAILTVVGAFRARRAGMTGWGWGLLTAVWMFLFGAVLLIAPVAGLVFVTVAFGFYAIMLGGLLIGLGLSFRRAVVDAGSSSSTPDSSASPSDDAPTYIDDNSAQL